MKRKQILLALPLAMAVLLLVSLPAEAISAKKILNKVSGQYEDLKDFRADFSQTVFIDSTDSAGYAAAGTLWVKTPAKFRLDLQHQVIISDGDTLWTYVPRNQQVLVDRADTTDGATRPDQLFLRYFQEAEAELLDTVELDEREYYLLHLKPEQEEAISQLRVWVDKKTWLARRLVVTDGGGMVTEYEFTDVRMNVGLADSLFVFRAPPEVEVIDLRW